MLILLPALILVVTGALAAGVPLWLYLLIGAQIRSHFFKLQSGLGKERLDQVRFLS
jgi:hypothetical protein